jgi:hypothetical protein
MGFLQVAGAFFHAFQFQPGRLLLGKAAFPQAPVQLASSSRASSQGGSAPGAGSAW